MEETADTEQDMIEFANGLDMDQLLEVVRQKAVEGSKDVLPLLKALFKASPPTSDECLARRLYIFKFVIKMFETVELPSLFFTNLMTVLINEIERFPTTMLMKLANFMAMELRECRSSDGKWLEVLPKLLSTIATRDTIVYQGLDSSGSDLKRLALKWMCNNASNSKAATQLASALRDVKLTREESEFVVKEMLGILPELRYQDMPTYVYQLLRFHVKDLHRKIMQCIIMYFVAEDKRVQVESESDSASGYTDLTALRQVEGSIILMIQCNCRANHSLSKIFISMLKDMQSVPEVALSPFVFSCAMSLSQIHQFQDQILDILKGAVLQYYHQREKVEQSFWIRDVLPIETDVTNLIKEAIQNSKQGWDHVGLGLIKFGFVLLDAFGPKLVAGKLPTAKKPHILTAPERACALGNLILRHTFRLHVIVREEIFDEILKRIVTNTVSPVTHYIDVLSKTVQGDPQLLLQALAKVISIIDYLPHMPYQNAVGLLKALSLLLKINMPLKDALMLVLRKALFHRDLESRKIGISGYLAILKKLTAVGKVTLSESQTFSSQSQSSSEKNANTAYERSRAMCLEIMSILQRVLMQQREVKQMLYEGLYDVVLNNSSLADIVLELLLSRLLKFYEPVDESKPPLDLVACVDNSEKNRLSGDEPIAHLITSITLILNEIKNSEGSDDDDDDLDDDFDIEHRPQAVTQKTIESLAKKMAEVELKLFNLDKSQELDNSDGIDKKELVSLLIAVYDSLIEYVFTKNRNFQIEDCELAVNLLIKRKNALKMVRDSDKKKSASKLKSDLNFSSLEPHLTLQFLKVIIEALFNNSNPKHNEGLEVLRSNHTFVKYILEAFNHKLTSYQETGKHDGFTECMPNVNEYLHSIARVYLKVFTEGLGPNFPSSDQTSISFFIIDGLRLIFSLMFSHDKNTYMKFIDEIARDAPSTHSSSAVRVMKKFERLLIRVLSDSNDAEILEQVTPLLSIISNLTLFPCNRDRVELHDFVKQLCLEQSFEDISITKKLFSLCLLLSRQQQNHMKFLLEVASDLHIELGDNDPSVEVPGTVRFNIINARSAIGLIAILLSEIDQVLDEVEWMLGIVKGQITYVTTKRETDSQCDKATMEDQLFRLFADLVKVIHKVLETAVPSGNSSSNVLKVVSSTYKCLTVMCKYYIMQYNDKNPSGLHPSFESIAKYSVTHFTPKVYAFITYLQSTDTSSDASKKSKKKKKTTFMGDIRLPPLVFAIEKYEQHLIMLAKKSKTNLMAHAKHTISRDFRIDARALEALEKQDEEEEGDISDETTSASAEERNISSSSKPASQSQVATSKRSRLQQKGPQKKKKALKA